MAFLAPAVPLAYTAISISIYTLALIANRYKFVCLAPMLFFQYMALATANHWPSNGVDSLWGLSVCIWTSQSISVLFFEDHNLIKDTTLHPTTQPWYWKAWTTWNNLRLLGTLREEPCTPQKFYGCESRSQFAIARTTKLTVYCVLLHFIQPIVIPGAFMPFQPSDFDVVRQTYIRRIFSDIHPITIRETTLRATFAVFWAWVAYAMLDAAHAGLSIFLVLILRFDKPQQWPPIFGHLREASSLRGFWGKFWHRLVVLPYSNFGNCIAEKAFGFRPGTRPHKLVVAFAIFVISGVAHSVIAWQLGDRCGWHLDVCWFCLNFVACAVEGAVWSGVSRQSAMPLTPDLQRLALKARKCLGFVWVFAFFFWSVSKWQYPKMYCLLTNNAFARDEQ